MVKGLTDVQRRLAESGLDAARRSVWYRAPAVAALCNMSLEDVRQEAYLACCKAAQTFSGEGDFERYAAMAARNKIRMILRYTADKCRDTKVVCLSEADDLEKNNRITPTLTDRRRRTCLKLVRSLPPREQSIIRLVFQGLNNCQIGRALNINEATVRVAIRRVTLKLSKLLIESN